jgi:hypothetical protein
MTEKDQGADLRPILPTTRTALERHLGADLWRTLAYREAMAATIERERSFYEGDNGRCAPVATAPVEPVEADQAA